jgi:hypothetical protein
MRFARTILAISLALLAACTTTTEPGAIGITRQQLLLVPAADVERMALTHYTEQYNRAKTINKLIESGPMYERLRKIGGRLISHTGIYRDDIGGWKWHLTLIDAPVLNATCAPGGKITFFTGIIQQLNLTDDEIAAIMGHEIAQALREHGREKVSEAMGQQFLVAMASASSKSPAATAALANQVSTIHPPLPREPCRGAHITAERGSAAVRGGAQALTAARRALGLGAGVPLAGSTTGDAVEVCGWSRDVKEIEDRPVNLGKFQPRKIEVEPRGICSIAYRGKHFAFHGDVVAAFTDRLVILVKVFVRIEDRVRPATNVVVDPLATICILDFLNCVIFLSPVVLHQVVSNPTYLLSTI